MMNSEILTYMSEGTHIGFSIATVLVPHGYREAQFQEFSDLVTRDDRIPKGTPMRSNDDSLPTYQGREIWHPIDVQPKAFGVAFIPMLFSEGMYLDGYEMGFQGFDEGSGIFIAGHYDRWAEKYGHMRVMSAGAGLGISQVLLEKDIRQFSEKTGFQIIEMDSMEKLTIEKNVGKILGNFETNPAVLEDGIYILAPFIALGFHRRPGKAAHEYLSSSPE